MHRADVWYHVTARGTDRKRIFKDDRDRRHWLELLPEVQERLGLRIFAYVMMENHYHVVLAAPELNLSRAMQWLQTSYSMWFNRRHGRVGPLFQGRFKAVVLEPDAFAHELSRYVHLNPVRVKGLGLDKRTRRAARVGIEPEVSRDLVKQRLKVLREFGWSSYHAYTGRAKAPEWLDRDLILARSCRGTVTEQEQAYRRFVEEAVREGIEDSPWEKLVGQVALGSAEWVRKLCANLPGRKREQPQSGLIQERPMLAQAVAAVEKLRELEWAEFRKKRGDWGRNMVWYLGWHRCALTLRELGESAGGVDYAAVSAAIKSLERRLPKDRALQRRLKAAEQALDFKF